MSLEPHAFLEAVSAQPDRDIDLAMAALALAAQDSPGRDPGRYVHHLNRLAADVAERHKAAGGDEIEDRLATLKHVLTVDYGYTGDRDDYDNLDNANLIRVIDRAKGMPITLSILHIHAARAQGWEIAGLNVPGHFVCRLEKGGRRLIFDPFEECRVLDAADLRLHVKKVLGPQAELSADYFSAASNREILIRLQNNIKLRRIEAEDYAGALKTVELMRLVDPGEYRLLLDAGVLYARNNQPKAAIGALESYISQAPDSRDRQEAALFLRQIRGSLN